MFQRLILLACLISMFVAKVKSNTDTTKFSFESLPKTIYAKEAHIELAKELKSLLEIAIKSEIEIIKDFDNESKTGIYLISEPLIFQNNDYYFILKSTHNAIKLIGRGDNELEYALFTFLEELGLRLYMPNDLYYPERDLLTFPKSSEKHYKPSFEYRALLYPASYEKSFRKWHKLDWHIEDFGIWGHSFDKLIPPEDYFESHPEFFAFYEGSRRYESLCMTNNKGFHVSSVSLNNLLKSTPDSRFYSISQNDDLVYCECRKCDALNRKYGTPSGSLYYFLNKHAKKHPTTQFVSLAYLHTTDPPNGILPQHNITTLYCPIEMNRGMSINSDPRSELFRTRIKNWKNFNPNLFLWDYTVQFTHYLSPFPNIHTFQDNLKFYKDQGVLGLFLQGYADIHGDFSELRQYLLSKLLWDNSLDVDLLTKEFLEYFYGPANSYVWEYLKFLKEAQQESNRFLDIYSGPVQQTKDFLSPYWMDKFDQIISLAEKAVENLPPFNERVDKIRIGLEYVYFEQAKYYGKDRLGMFKWLNNEWQVPENLTLRVKDFVQKCEKIGIYELGEGGLTPQEYFENWIKITNESVIDHKGIEMEGNWLTEPAPEYKSKGFSSLIDGLYGSRDFNVGWTGWYGNDAELILKISYENIQKVELGFLNDQRHWIFPPQSVSISGFQNGEWHLIKKEFLPKLEEDFEIKSKKIQVSSGILNNFEMLKIVVENQKSVPEWRRRAGKKPLLMIDEIVLW